jgi:hypothetical protein
VEIFPNVFFGLIEQVQAVAISATHCGAHQDESARSG